VLQKAVDEVVDEEVAKGEADVHGSVHRESEVSLIKRLLMYAALLVLWQVDVGSRLAL
jgi:hypothetical protein